MRAERVIVAGAGLSGLACAFDLARRGVNVTLLEARDRAGGVVGTVEREGFRFELGPTTVHAGSEQFRRLCGELGIADRLIAASPQSRERYLFHRGRLRPLPSSPLSFLTSPVLSLRSRAFALTEPLRRWVPPPGDAAEPDFGAFVSERLGREAARLLAGAFVRGVYAAEPSELGARSAFPRLWSACQERGGVVRGLLAGGRQARPDLPGPRVRRSALLSFPAGLGEIVVALASALGRRLRTRSPVESIERRGEGWRARVGRTETFEAERLVLALPAPAAARLLAPVAPSGFPLDHLRRIGHAELALVNLGLERAALASWPKGFGYLVAPGPEGQHGDAPWSIGTIFTSNVFPGRAPEGCVAVASFYRSVDVVGLDERALVDLAREDLARAVGHTRAPDVRVSDVCRWKDVLPRHGPGHAARMEELLAAVRDRLPGLHLTGSYVGGVSVEQVVSSGRKVADEIAG